MMEFLLVKRAMSVAVVVLSISGFGHYAADVISIAAILVSPNSFHRQAVMLHGVVKEIIP